MWKKEELIEIRRRAKLESGGTESNLLWRNACISMAASADRLISLTDRICIGEITALSDKNGKPILPPASAE